MAVSLASRTIDGIDAPASGTWTIDPSHSRVGFTARHLMVAKVRGHFASFSGAIRIGERPEDSSVDVTIDATSIDTRDARRDEHLRSADFFDADNHAAITFRSTRVEGAAFREGERFKLYGELTVRGMMKEIVLEATYEGRGRDPWGQEKAAFTAEGKLDRHDFGLTWNQALEAGGVLVGRDVRLTIDAQFVRASEA